MIGGVGAISLAGRMRAGSAPWTPADAGAALLSWMRGDDPGASINTTPTPHQYAAIPDRGSIGGSFAQATSGNQPQVSTAWAPSPAPLFPGPGRLAHSAAPASFAFLHDGLSAYLLSLVVRPTADGAVRHIAQTYTGVTSDVGLNLRLDTNNRLVVTFGNGTGSTALNILGGTGTVLTGNTYTFTLSVNGTSVTAYQNGAVVGSGPLSSPSASAPAHTLGVGTHAAFFDSGSPIWIPEIVLFKDAPPDRSVVEEYLSRWSYTP